MNATAVVFAYHDVGCRCLSVLLARGVRVSLVVTHRDDPGETVWFASVERLAREAGIEVAMPDDPGTPAFVARLAAIAPDFLFSFYYRRMLSAAVLATAKRGAYNMHGSLLPRYRGRVPVNWAIIHGERETGATLHEMVAKPDAGRIVGRQAVPIGENDTAAEVFGGVTQAAGSVLERAIAPLVDGTAVLQPQALREGSYFGARRPEDGRVDWTRSARVLRSWWSDPPALGEAAPGTVRTESDKAWVCCGDGRWLELREVEIADEGAYAGVVLASRFAPGAGGMGQFTFA